MISFLTANFKFISRTVLKFDDDMVTAKHSTVTALALMERTEQIITKGSQLTYHCMQSAR